MTIKRLSDGAKKLTELKRTVWFLLHIHSTEYLLSFRLIIPSTDSVY